MTLTNRIADAIRADIASGVLPPGAELPSERELVDTTGMSRGTVRRGLAVLLNEGLIQAKAGVGYSVRQYQQLNWSPGLFEHLKHRRDTVEVAADAWAADVLAQGRTPRQEVEVSITYPPMQVVERLGTGDSEMVVVRKRLRLVDEVPYQLADSYYPLDVAEGTPIMQPGDVTVVGGLMAAAGHRQVRFADEIVARMPTPHEAHRFGLPLGTPVAAHVRTGYNRDNRPVRVIITVAPGDRNRIIYETAAE